MKVIKILLRVLFTLFALAIFSTGVNVGFIKSSVVAVLFVISGFLMTHPIALNAANFNDRNLENRKFAMFLFGMALLALSCGLLVSSELHEAVKAVMLASMVGVVGYVRFWKKVE